MPAYSQVCKRYVEPLNFFWATASNYSTALFLAPQTDPWSCSATTKFWPLRAEGSAHSWWSARCCAQVDAA
jgi:hypothetical protein